jgi:cholesterol transport system auxiliary component
MKPNNIACHARQTCASRLAAIVPTVAAISSALAIALLGGCTSLLPPPPPPDNVYLLESGVDQVSSAASPRGDARAAQPKSDRVIAVGLPRARAGYDSARMVWVQQEHGLKVYSRNRWADTPARMLMPLIAQALERAGGFHAVVQAPSAASATLRLDTELVRLQQDFSMQPSRVQFTLGVQLVDIRTRQVIASAEFDEVEIAETEDAYGGVRAANRALQRLLARIADFCVRPAPAS